MNVTYFRSQTGRLLSLLVLLALLKGIIYSIIVPLWEFPDEQAHFAEVSQRVETGPGLLAKDLSREIYQAELVMGTARDYRGQNFYTYNWGHKILYSNQIDGVYEGYLKSLPHSYRTEYVKREAAKYPPLFYELSSLGYRLSYQNDLITRVFYTRMISVVISMFSIVIAFAIGRHLFRSQLYALVLAVLISFHPMFSFVSAGINNDNLTNLWGLVLIWLVLILFKQGLNYKISLSIGLISGLAIYTKPLILPLILGVGVAILWEWVRSRRSFFKEFQLLFPLVVAGLFTGGWIIFRSLFENGRLPYITTQKEYGLPDLTFVEYLIPKLGQYYRETLVWYWGVYKWLGVILPLNLIRIIKVVMVISGVGVFKSLIKPSVVEEKYQVSLMIMLSLVFIGVLTVWDYHGVKSNGFSHGLQGRYFFPTIGAHVSLLLIGILSLSPKSLRLAVAKLAAVAMICAQLISWKVLVQSYYSTDSVHVLFTQMSQYKVWFLKYPYASIWISFYFVLLGIFVVKLLRYNDNLQVKV